jgi:RNA polymerase sigma-70 factor (ECF subfamily)
MDQIYRTALGMVKDPVKAEDLVQDTYLKAWRFYHKYEGGTNFRAWLFRILTNTFINEYRRVKRQPGRADFETIAPMTAAQEVSIADAAPFLDIGGSYDELFDDKIKEALDSLPEHYRIVTLLADISELSYQEIAELLGCPIGTVMSRLHRARKMLAHALKAYACAGGYISA